MGETGSTVATMNMTTKVVNLRLNGVWLDRAIQPLRASERPAPAMFVLRTADPEPAVPRFGALNEVHLSFFAGRTSTVTVDIPFESAPLDVNLQLYVFRTGVMVNRGGRVICLAWDDELQDARSSDPEEGSPLLEEIHHAVSARGSPSGTN